jgi:hypothetical protein
MWKSKKFFISKTHRSEREAWKEMWTVWKTGTRCGFDFPEVTMEVVEVNRCGVGPRGDEGVGRKDERGDRWR